MTKKLEIVPASLALCQSIHNIDTFRANYNFSCSRELQQMYLEAFESIKIVTDICS